MQCKPEEFAHNLSETEVSWKHLSEKIFVEEIIDFRWLEDDSAQRKVVFSTLCFHSVKSLKKRPSHSPLNIKNWNVNEGLMQVIKAKCLPRTSAKCWQRVFNSVHLCFINHVYMGNVVHICSSQKLAWMVRRRAKLSSFFFTWEFTVRNSVFSHLNVYLLLIYFGAVWMGRGKLAKLENTVKSEVTFSKTVQAQTGVIAGPILVPGLMFDTPAVGKKNQIDLI